MHNNFLFKTLFFLVGSLFFLSCDKDFNEVGSNLIGGNNFELKKKTFSVLAYNEKITPIESKNLPLNALGIYNNPAFGKTTANFATQLTLATLNPTIGNNAVIDSVYVDIPYFIDASKTKSIPNNSAGIASGFTYELDSIYGDKLSKIKLRVYESSIDMDSDGADKIFFYTNKNALFDGEKIGNHLNDDADKSQNDEFFFNPKQNTLKTTNADATVTRSYSAPSMRLKLNATFFKNKIFSAPRGTLSDQFVFRKHFKGLYFKVEQSGSDKGSMAMLNFTRGNITIKYKEDLSTTVGGVTTVTRVEKSIILNMTGNSLSFLEDSNQNTKYETAINSNPSRTFNDKNLYLKGGTGSLAVLKIFDNPSELDLIRKEKWLINDANIVFYIDTLNTEFKESHEPERIYLYNFKNNIPLIDFFAGTATTNKNNSIFTLGGFIKRDATLPKRGVCYKINITNHIRTLVKNKNAENVKLGLVVTEDINVPGFNLLEAKNDFINQAPKSAVMNPLGTILYGSGADIPEKKRLKLEISYTKLK